MNGSNHVTASTPKIRFDILYVYTVDGEYIKKCLRSRSRDMVRMGRAHANKQKIMRRDGFLVFVSDLLMFEN